MIYFVKIFEYEIFIATNVLFFYKVTVTHQNLLIQNLVYQILLNQNILNYFYPNTGRVS